MSGEAIDVAIIGAGPFGLSIAAHLSSHKVAFRIFGTPMSSWRNHMAAGTFLKSFGFASCLYDPGSTFTFAHYCQERGIHYDEVITPVALENFTAYGMEFQRRFVPNLEQTDITSLRRMPEGFALTTETGEVVLARRVVVAVGITYFGYVPPIFADLPEELVTHSSPTHSRRPVQRPHRRSHWRRCFSGKSRRPPRRRRRHRPYDRPRRHRPLPRATRGRASPPLRTHS